MTLYREEKLTDDVFKKLEELKKEHHLSEKEYMELEDMMDSMVAAYLEEGSMMV